MLITISIISVLVLLTGTVAHADGLEETLKAYLNSSKFDLFGRRYDELIFNRDYNLYEDLKTIPLQAKCLLKIFDQNKYLYAPLGGAAGLKAVMGEKAFSKMLFEILKMVVK